MRKPHFCLIPLVFAFLILAFPQCLLIAQQPADTQDDYMKGEDFTRILKDEWSYLKDETDAYLAATAKKSEFETTKEFGERVARLKAAYINKINSHIAEKKFDRRVFGVLFKTSLVSYNADLQQYLIASSESIEAPYDIPTLHCTVPRNPYVVLTDSVNRGFRTSALRIKFPPKYRWNAPRDEAKMAKGDEANVYFLVRFVLDLRQEGIVKRASMKMIPTQISMISLPSHKIYWSTEIK
jgi:hypothetical protein